MPSKIKQVIIDNRTPYDLVVCYKGVADWKLHIAVTIHPKTDPLLADTYNEYVVVPGSRLPIPLKDGWNEFNGVIFDTSRVLAKTLGANKFTVENSHDFIVIIREMTN